MHQEEEERQKDYLEAQIARAAERAGRDEGQNQATELIREENGGAALKMALPKSRLGQNSNTASRLKPAVAFQQDGNARIEGGPESFLAVLCHLKLMQIFRNLSLGKLVRLVYCLKEAMCGLRGCQQIQLRTERGSYGFNLTRTCC